MALPGGRYETLGAIASGGMATVHPGRARGAGGFERIVAIKRMHPHLAEEPEFVAMFLDEARLAARIRHPNVVATLDVEQDEAGLFLVMEYVEGPSLQRLLRDLRKSRGTMPVAIAIRIFIDVLAGLHAAHELVDAEGEPLRLIHRDVSPHNVLLGNDGIARLTDFGVARAESRLTSTKSGAVKGKIPYLAPEQCHAQPIDRRVDIYAAGALLWELLAGERLIQGGSDAEMLSKILDGDHPAPRRVRGVVPEAISNVCMQALCFTPDERYPTAAAFADALEAAAEVAALPIASHRAVAAFVEGCEIGTPSSAKLSMSGSGLHSSPPRSLIPSSSTSGLRSSPLDTDPAFLAPRRSPDTPSINVSIDDEAQTIRGRETPRRVLILGCLVGAVVLGAAALFLQQRGALSTATGSGLESPHATSAPAALGVPPSSLARSPASAANTEPSPARPDERLTGVRPSASPSAATSAVNAADAANAANATKRGRLPHAASPPPPPAPAPQPTTQSAASFRPKEL